MIFLWDFGETEGDMGICMDCFTSRSDIVAANSGNQGLPFEHQ